MPTVLRRLPIPVAVALTLTALFMWGCTPSEAPGAAESLTVFAAASLQDLMSDLVADLGRSRPIDMTVSFAGSNTLAQQILAAPGADVFLSANSQWMDRLQEAGRLTPGSRRDLLSNRLVVAARHDCPFQLRSLKDLAELPFRRLAIGDPEAVPAGHYARAALEAHGLWQTLTDRVVPSPDVRAAMALVEADPEFLGIIYKTDALTSDKVQVLLQLDTSDHPPIVYTAAAIADSPRGRLAELFLDYLSSPEAAAIIERHGFLSRSDAAES